jgi:secreted trypsin-like serine protease
MQVAGWGITESKKRSDVLLKAQLPVLSTDQCNDALRSKISARFLTLVTEDQICAGGGDADSNRGDSGGPLQFITRWTPVNSRYVQYGIVSYGYNPTSGEILPSVFTRVTSYMSWILDNMAK